MNVDTSLDLAPDTRFAIDREAIATKVIDGEAIIINLASGLYFSTDGVGALIWERVVAGQSAAEILGALDETFGIERPQLERDVGSFLSSLLAEDLVKFHDGEGAGPGVAVDGEAPVAAYKAPQLERYDDLAHFFALDPPLPAVD
jgi:hypothetical protein